MVGLNNQDTVKYLVEKKEANTNAQDNDRNTPAHYAAQNRNLKMLNYLQQHGSNLNTKNNNDQTPMCILTKGCTFDSHEVLPHEKSQRLLNIDLINAAGEGNLSEVRNLIKKGADINYTSVWSVLHAAASSGNQRLVEYLIEEKKFNNIDLKDNFYGGTPLNVAARYGNLKIVKYLISKGANPNIKQNFSNQNTPAHEAATRNDLVMLNYLKNEGKADLNIKNRNGSTPVDLLSEENKVKFLNQVSHNRKRRDIVATTNALPSNIQNGFINLVQDNSTNSPMQIGYQEHNILVPEINSNVINGIIILGVLTAGLLNKTRHKQPVPEELLPPIEQSRKINNFDGGLQNLSEGIRKCGGDSLNRKRRDITEGQSVSWFSSIKDTVVNLVDSFVNLLVGDSKDTMTFQENSSTSNKLSLSTLSTKLTNETQSKQLKIDKDLLQLVDKSIQKNNASDIQHNLIGRIKNMNKKNNPRTNFDDVSVHGNITELQKNYVALT
ncbi:ankyrin repeat domain-containing protein [Wolbachia endosymbiont of Chironomus riparius]|uniref:ankyrin repeat domain-containing protein n=1 Tax=Wolbachia endosymbiont of Chironomus riparius TaxID=2883238 RepID=UPI00209CA75E|nr:ankyrin repeat domain-containing protein [Wolbachia endosymbiont of Chironomus riparius]